MSSFQKLGPRFGVEQIVKVRDAAGQRAMGVPEAHLGGHAFHTYRLTSPDGLVSFEFQVRGRPTRGGARALRRAALRPHSHAAPPPAQHNVCGRSIYAQGTVDAVAFIAARARERAPKTLYNMVDVLAAGMQ